MSQLAKLGDFLATLQRRNAYSDGYMAKKLSITRPHWNRVKRGHALAGWKILHGAFKAFPEETRVWLSTEGAHGRNKTAGKPREVV